MTDKKYNSCTQDMGIYNQHCKNTLFLQKYMRYNLNIYYYEVI